jgi:hypothetical protein
VGRLPVGRGGLDAFGTKAARPPRQDEGQRQFVLVKCIAQLRKELDQERGFIQKLSEPIFCRAQRQSSHI